MFEYLFIQKQHVRSFILFCLCATLQTNRKIYLNLLN